LGALLLAGGDPQTPLNGQNASARAASPTTGQSTTTRAVVRDVSPQIQLEVKKALELAAIYPSSLKCRVEQPKVVCQRVASRSVLARIKAGQPMYQRIIRQGLTLRVIKARIPIFDASELVCVRQGSAPFECDRVTDVAPKIEPRATVMVTYRPYHVTFYGGHVAVMHGQAVPTIPLRRQ
jgi:hypothetical protein